MNAAGRYFSLRRGLQAFVVSGRYAQVLDALASQLERAQYSFATIQGYLRGARHVTYCLEKGVLKPAMLTRTDLRIFARDHAKSCTCPIGKPHSGALHASLLHHLLPLLREQGFAVPDPAAHALSPLLHELLAAFELHEEEVRGLRLETRTRNRRALLDVLRHVSSLHSFDLNDITSERVQAHVLALAGRMKPATVRRHLDAVRKFARFLKMEGHTVDTLDGVRAPVRPCSLQSQRALTEQQLRMLFLPYNTPRPHSRRDLAILLLLAHLGLRRNELRNLRLGDFSARARTLSVAASKTRTPAMLPVPHEVQEALLAYIRHERLASVSDALFLTEAYPYTAPISADAISGVVKRAFKLSGVTFHSYGVHVLRHYPDCPVIPRRAASPQRGVFEPALDAG